MTTIYVVYVRDIQTKESVYQCETPDESQAQRQVDKINDRLSDAGRPCTAFYTP